MLDWGTGLGPSEGESHFWFLNCMSDIQIFVAPFQFFLPSVSVPLTNASSRDDCHTIKDFGGNSHPTVAGVIFNWWV